MASQGTTASPRLIWELGTGVRLVGVFFVKLLGFFGLVLGLFGANFWVRLVGVFGLGWLIGVFWGLNLGTRLDSVASMEKSMVFWG